MTTRIARQTSLRALGLLLGLYAATASAAETTAAPAGSAEAKAAPVDDTDSWKPNGFRVGPGKLHPYLDVVGRFDSLVGFFTRTGATNTATPDIVFNPRGGLRYDIGTSSTSFSFNGFGEGLIYTGAWDVASRNLSRFQAGINADAQFNKDGPVEVALAEALTRSDKTQNLAASVGLVSTLNVVRLGVPIHPGGGALEITPSVGWAVEFFEALLTGAVPGCQAGDITCNPGLVNRMDYSNLAFGLAGRWRFLPKTSFLVDTGFDYRTYWTPTATTRPTGVFRSAAGLSGLITTKIAASLLAGYTGEWLGQNVHTFNVRGEVTYAPSELASFSLGYMRAAAPVPVFGVMGTDRGALNARLSFLRGRITVSAGFAGTLLTLYAPSATPGGAPTVARSDLILDGTVGPTFEVTSWFQVSAQYALLFRKPLSNAAATSALVDFLRHEVSLRLTLRY